MLVVLLIFQVKKVSKPGLAKSFVQNQYQVKSYRNMGLKFTGIVNII